MAYLDPKNIKEIIIHCADTYEDQDIDIDDVRRWHVEERGWDDVGYHYFVKRDGTIQKGRGENIMGAHCLGHNDKSIGICYAGGKGKDGHPQNNINQKQIESIKSLIIALKDKYKKATVHGHNEFSSKACPSFDVQDYFSDKKLYGSKPLSESRTIKGAVASGVGTAGATVAESLTQASDMLKPLVPYADTMKYIFLAVTVLGIALTIYARIDDKKKGVK